MTLASDVHDFAVGLVNAYLATIVEGLEAHAIALVGGGVVESHVRHVHRHLFVDDTALLTDVRVRLDVLLGQVDVLDHDAVLENAFHPLYRSPVRPDPRPLHGVLLAVHAFLPVARLYERMIEDGAPGSDHPDFRRRYAQIIGKNREGAAVLLEHARPTPIGAGVLEEIRRWDAHFASRSSI